MPNTHGFDVVAEVSVKFLRTIFRSAWKSGGKKLGEPLDPGTIPEALDIPPGTPFGNFTLEDGHIQIPQDQLDLSLVAGKGVDLKVGLVGHGELKNSANPAVPSIKLQEIQADVHIIAPIGPLLSPPHGPNDIGVQLQPAPATTVTLTGPDPAARLDQLIAEQFRTIAAANPSLPDVIGIVVVYGSIPAYTVSERLDIVTDASHPIDAVRVPGSPPHLILKVPVQWSLFSIVPKPGVDPPPPILQGVLVNAVLAVDAILEDDPMTTGGFQVRLNAPTTKVTVQGVAPGGAVDHYTGNQARLGPEFDSIVEAHIRDRGREFLLMTGNLAISVPTVASIQNALAKLISDTMFAIGFITIWPPKAPAGLPLSIADATVKVLSDVMALAINRGPGADENALTNFIPPTRDLAFGFSADGVKNIFETIKRDQHIFHRYSGDGHDFDLKSLDLSLKPDALHFDGDMTVINAIAFSIDVDASFGVDVHLRWDPGNKLISTPDTPDVHTKLSILAWVVSLILGFLTFGGLGVVIAIVVVKICEEVAANIGTDITKDQNFTSVAGWPSDLPQIGNVKADFDNPIDINTDGLLFSAKVTP